jgi:hypothetical protein
MAGKLASFLSGNNVIIRIGKKQIAYCQNLSFSRDVPLAPVTGIGSYSVHALEPLGYTASGSFQILRYTSDLFSTYKPISDALGDKSPLPDNMKSTKLDGTFNNGNSLLDRASFNPLELLISYSFDIEVYERKGKLNTSPLEVDNTGNLIFKFVDCRLDGYSFDFTPGSLLVENVSFVCRVIEDRLANDSSSIENVGVDSTTITI